MIELTMKRKLALFLVFLGLLAAVVGVVKLLTGRSGKLGELRVESAPPASVFLDNKHLGRTPFKDKVQAGEYTIKIVPEGTTPQLASWQGQISVGANLLTYVNANLAESELASAVDVLWLEKISGKLAELSITTNPDGASVLVDDETKGVTPLSLTDISTGDHSVTVTSPGFLSRTIKIKITPGYRVISSLKLALSAAGVPTPTPTPETTSMPTPTKAPKATPTKTATSSASTQPDPAKPFVIIKDTPTGFLRVRMEPTTSATESGRVNPGEKYHLEDTKSGWYQIKYDGTRLGWISGQYAEKVE
ncbi:TPA: hypothetical protein DIV55_06625 [Patescibacteria group bacterium]|uniref:SH3b domain-containing protein n=2 Tax=Candidatus Gottesmaniibacteriota TaxID=1752720 RepID=A0A0G1X0Z4_9BACT|nr:MAG: hypothetical protein UY16_C0002G0025 [Candidatus Gottesmanbacteria bacterium GW2011_GWA2_47_9]KKU96238.1 MAG: hypothetical protein UY27_C0002G0023 [Candidatus Gottesmanbacteria bacterium GW2011_GWA1_48_13]HCS79379.1 hypothetical protein [Patescibacteria group bacterium]